VGGAIVLVIAFTKYLKSPPPDNRGLRILQFFRPDNPHWTRLMPSMCLGCGQRGNLRVVRHNFVTLPDATAPLLLVGVTVRRSIELDVPVCEACHHRATRGLASSLRLKTIMVNDDGVIVDVPNHGPVVLMAFGQIVPLSVNGL